MADVPLEAESNFDAGGEAALGTEQVTDPIAQNDGPAPSDNGQSAADDAGKTGDTGTPAEQSTSTPETEEFFDPTILDEHPDLRPAYKSMQKAFTQKTTTLAEGQKKIDAYTALESRFAADPKGTIKQLAESQGMTLAEPGTQADKPNPFGEGWEPNNWSEVSEGLMGMVRSEINKSVNPINRGLNQIENNNFESRLDGIMPEWREHEQAVADTLTMAPGLMKDPEKLLRASLPQSVIEGRAMQLALKRIKSQSESSKVGGSSTSTTRPESSLGDNPTFQEAAAAAMKELEGT